MDSAELTSDYIRMTMNSPKRCFVYKSQNMASTLKGHPRLDMDREIDVPTGNHGPDRL